MGVQGNSWAMFRTLATASVGGVYSEQLPRRGATSRSAPTPGPLVRAAIVRTSYCRPTSIPTDEWSACRPHLRG
jgi:hypothetical protein